MEVVQSKCETSDVLEVLDLSDNCLKAEDATVSVAKTTNYSLPKILSRM